MSDDDTRVTCIACMAYREGRCTRAAAAGLHPDKYRPGTAEVGRTLATLPQHCNGFSPARKARP
jgi:hypothetical protein